MTEEEKVVISEYHARELAAPFNFFEHEGLIYHNVGLLQAWVRGYTDPESHPLDDPPVWTNEFKEWLKENNSEIVEGFIGPPAVRFPNNDIAQAFKIEWHDKSRERYPYKQFGDFLRRNKRI